MLDVVGNMAKEDMELEFMDLKMKFMHCELKEEVSMDGITSWVRITKIVGDDLLVKEELL